MSKFEIKPPNNLPSYQYNAWYAAFLAAAENKQIELQFFDFMYKKLNANIPIIDTAHKLGLYFSEQEIAENFLDYFNNNIWGKNVTT